GKCRLRYRIADLAEREPSLLHQAKALRQNRSAPRTRKQDRACMLPLASSWRNGPAEKVGSAC
ncbi:MAG TPA: hypothetical protein VKG87_07400, partial [Terriglobales bacterium]|nr:hypothetical protein [Terriglobales bacterium]